ncbi:uncharacterized protein ACA1_234010 [Acanthamoeba castellanii str. Neff]|jgi:hypothetical protein|uniref:Uncharacterized protein n=1 Tax=Acanthamoeba castellanii (strain ATCC 30010 / Neff) TaxID=1257118 RepID=L8H2I8_ACACF|nr:uncharacterized protein ACA1_234010 [Acanthamoeba castellanii str. Neff]ELR18963.1 hypothetical protein ACA1_234010 [Acanthamoeba castellanii str. Neff]
MKYGRLVEVEVPGELGVVSFVSSGAADKKKGAAAAAKPNVTKIRSGEYDRIVNWMLSFFDTY